MLLLNRARRAGIHRYRWTEPLHEVAARTQRSCRGESSKRRLSGLRVVTCPTSKRLVTVFSNTRLILAPAIAFTSGGTATGSLFCSRVARRSASKKTSARQRRIGKTTGTGRPREEHHGTNQG